jgi:cellulose biosynthesis protein BcsQ
MNARVTNKELGEYYGGDTEGAMRALKARDPKRYNAMVKGYLEAQEEERMAKDPFVITMLMFKGGIGKSVLSRLFAERLSMQKSVIFNLDLSRDVREYTSQDAINYAEVLAEEPDMEVGEYVDLLKEAADYVIIDTPGEIGNRETLGAIKKTDLFVMPFGVSKEEKNVLKTTLITTVLADDGFYPEGRDINILFVLNNYKEQESLEQTKELMGEIIELIQNRENQDNEVNIFFSHLKYSKAIVTMDETKKGIKELSTENFVAYRVAKERIQNLMKDVRSAISESREVLYG